MGRTPLPNRWRERGEIRGREQVVRSRRMKLKSPGSLESWLLAIGAALLLLAVLLWAVASIWIGRERAQVPSGENLGVAGAYLAFDLPISILELGGLGCVILSALVSIFRTFLPARLK